MISVTGRRHALQSLGIGLTVGVATMANQSSVAHAAEAASLLPEGARSLRELTTRLSAAPRRRRFKTVPMILTDVDQWDHEALSEVLAYQPPTKQAWDMTDMAGPWLNLMRNALNAQIWSFRHPDFLVVAECHGTAQLALYDPAMWDKYQLGQLTGGKFKSNALLLPQPAESVDPRDFENPAGPLSPADNAI
ncbi:MAG TPA: transcriptional initiation protein Tat, partial [Rhodopila sp.]